MELDKQILPPLDPEMASIVHEHIQSKGVNLILGDAVTAINETPQAIQLTLRSGRSISTDMVLISVGVTPNIKLAREANITIGPRGGIQVNEYMETSDPYIYAIGDAIEVVDFINGKNARIPLAGPANKQGRIAADNIAGKRSSYHGTQGTAIAKVFDMTVATTGNNEKQLKFHEIPYIASYTHSASHASYYPGALPMSIKLLFNNKGRILGAQIVGYEGVDKRIDVISAVIRLNGTVYDLQELELAYAPPYSSAKDPINMAGYVAGNILNETVSIIHWHEMSDIDTENTVILDVREPFEREAGFIPHSVNIPLNKLRDQLTELPKNKPVVVYCQVGLRAYIAARILMQNGFADVRNLSGGYTTYAAGNLEVANDVPSASVQPTVEETEGSPDIKQTRYLDGSGLQSSDLIVRVEQLMESMQTGEVLQVVTADPGFVIDMNVWCKNTANPFLSARKDGEEFVIMIKKGTLKS